ncbi:MAG: PAS domain S-box protein [Proteobacteria bacterium]|nr:PAS domain S-box protein [Pseudomonadota bacterium]
MRRLAIIDPVLRARDHESLLASAFENAPDAMVVVSQHGVIESLNAQAERLFGYPRQELLGENLEILVPERFGQRHVQHREVFFAAPSSRPMGSGLELLGLGRDGREFPIEISLFSVAGAQGRLVVAAIRDITDRLQAEQALRERDERLADAVESLSNGIILFDADEKLILCNGVYREMFPELAGILDDPETTIDDIVHVTAEAKQAVGQIGDAAAWAALRLKRFRAANESHEQRLSDGRWILASERRTRSGGTVGLRADITERKHAEQANRENSAQLRYITDALPARIAYVDSEKRYRFVNRMVEQHEGLPGSSIIGKTMLEVLGPERYEQKRAHCDRALAGESFVESWRGTFDGKPADIRATFVSNVGENGRVAGFILLVEDVSEARAIGEQLRRAQKLQAIGQLTGGIAHDFNNLIGAVLGNLELLEDIVEDQNAKRFISVAKRASLRGTELTHRLLAFSRQQELRPTRIDVPALVQDVQRLLLRTLGDHIQVVVKSAPGLPSITADAAQLENAIINLAINARDAMPAGGTLTIEVDTVTLTEAEAGVSRELEPGPYVLLSIQDTGSGIPADTLDKVFEPFFTTKDVGIGTGLGLSMVHGFMKQSKGHIAIDSEEGVGTKVKLYLPANPGGPEPIVEKPVDQPLQLPRGNESVLIVEDDADIRNYVVQVLNDLGYAVSEAEDGPSAIELADRIGHVSLLVSDVVLPCGLNGSEVADRFRLRFPEMKTLFISGHARGALMQHNEGVASQRLLSKPFTREELAREVRAALEQ